MARLVFNKAFVCVSEESGQQVLRELVLFDLDKRRFIVGPYHSLLLHKGNL